MTIKNQPIGPKSIIELKTQYFFPNSMHFYKEPPQLVRGSMQYLWDHQDKRYTDFFSGVTVVNCGHCNPEITEAVSAQLHQLQHTSIIYLTQPMVQLAEKLSVIMPGDINRSFFCCSGTEANEGAMLLARLHTGKKGFIAFNGGLHGRSALTMSVTGIPMWRIDPFLSEDVYFADCYCQTDMSADEAAMAALNQIREILEAHSHEIAACIAEPLQGNGGMNTPPLWFFKELKALLNSFNVLLIIDEVQTGFGRTGKPFAIEHFDVVPDLLTMAKALGNGVPIGAFAATEAVAKSMNKPSASTLGGNPVSAAAGIAVLDYMEKYDLSKRSEILGNILKTGLMRLKEKHPIIKDVRGLGLMLGAELNDAVGIDSASLADLILEKMKDKGFIIGKNGMGRNVLAFQPPLIIEEEDIQSMLSHLDAVFAGFCQGQR